MWQDLTHGARMLVKNPGFAFIAIIDCIRRGRQRRDVQPGGRHGAPGHHVPRSSETSP